MLKPLPVAWPLQLTIGPEAIQVPSPSPGRLKIRDYAAKVLVVSWTPTMVTVSVPETSLCSARRSSNLPRVL